LAKRAAPGGAKTKSSPREAILEAAVRCFVRQGIGATRAVDIAREAQVSPPLLAHHYPDLVELQKDAIGVVLKGLRLASVRAIETGGSDPHQALEAYIGAPFRWAAANRDLYSLWMCFYYLASYAAPLEALSHEIREAGRDRIALLIYRGVEAGVFRLEGGAKVTELAWTLQAMITGGVIMAGSEGRAHDDWPEHERRTREACLRLLGVRMR
jgi:AcrR family transcriptional regulator